MTPTPKPGVLEIAPYVGGRGSVAGMADAIKLSSNESALGPSPLALAAYARLELADEEQAQRPTAEVGPSARSAAA